MSSNEKSAIELMKINEESLSLLYEEYSEKAESYKKFWSELSNEELGHAKLIQNLIDKQGAGEVFFAKGRFKTAAISNSIKYIEEKITQARNQDLSTIETLSISYDLERALIERKYFEFFESDSVELKNLLEALQTSTEQHLERVKVEWDKEREINNLGKFEI